MNLVVAVDQNWGIGYHGQLLFHVSADMKHFRALTADHALVYGRKTLETFPHQRPLPHRTNYILSRNPNYTVPDAIVVHDTAELLRQLHDVPHDQIDVIGGASVYHALLPYCSVAHVTKFESAKPADAFFPNLDTDQAWTLHERGADQTTEDGLVFHFDTYYNTKVFDF